ncbi:glycosyltransferase family 39 protein [Acidisoma cellulosilytica]|uniref:Glycosyltransferase family 39 protein n=1 Tax=Acidisoma cellulosilyticum TaxID=2802395 RepID=A0A964E4I0_9PROT|nr:glycosyltransferase family 39 protein [Acidisoma cellulosilyticum]MCB8880998.1 glycosyltransferase family 39 protein [Acidisoma cellulosilyticum]
MSAADSARLEQGPRLLPWLIGAALVLVTLLSRAPAFVMSVVDWDESLYFIMAQQWRAGHLPYTAVWDNKPIGIYAIFAVFQRIFGGGILSMRLAGTSAIVAMALLTWRIARHYLRDQPAVRAELFAGIAGLLVIGTTIPDDGIAANTEIFMESFTLLGMLWALTPVGRIGAGRSIAIGLALGLAFMVKYVAVFDMFAVYAAMLIMPGRLRRGALGVWDMLRLGLLFSVGALAPFLATLGLYAVHGELPAMLSASILSNMRRVAVPVSGHLATRAFHAQMLIFPALYLSLLWLLGEMRHLSHRALPRGPLILGLWFVTSLLGVASGGLYFSHYFLQLLPVLCITTALMLAALFRSPSRALRWAVAVLFLLSLIPMLSRSAADMRRMVEDMGRPPVAGFGLLRDTPAEVAADLNPALAAMPGSEAYVFDGEPILYALLREPLPTKFVFPSFLLSKLLAHTVGIDPLAELNHILAQKPLFIIRRTNPDDQNSSARNLDVYAAMNAALGADYTVWKRYDTMVVYRRKP